MALPNPLSPVLVDATSEGLQWGGRSSGCGLAVRVKQRGTGCSAAAGCSCSNVRCDTLGGGAGAWVASDRGNRAPPA